MSSDTILAATSTIVSAYITGNPTYSADVATLIKGVYDTLLNVTQGVSAENATPKIIGRLSADGLVADDHVICAECGFSGSLLKGHIRSAHGLSPFDYRTKYGLAADHPLTAPSYSVRRSQLARESGLGRHR